MGKLSFIAALACLAAAPAAADPVERWRPHIAEASERFGIPVDWIDRVMRAESGGQTLLHGQPIVSHAGAMGLMQLMPGTWEEMREQLGLGQNPHDPRDNILAGTLYLRRMYDRFGYPGLFAAYNAGPARYTAHLAGRKSLPAETRAYMAKLVAGRTQHEAASPVGHGGAIFFASGSTVVPSGVERPREMDMFVGSFARHQARD